MENFDRISKRCEGFNSCILKLSKKDFYNVFKYILNLYLLEEKINIIEIADEKDGKDDKSGKTTEVNPVNPLGKDGKDGKRQR